MLRVTQPFTQTLGWSRPVGLPAPGERGPPRTKLKRSCWVYARLNRLRKHQPKFESCQVNPESSFQVVLDDTTDCGQKLAVRAFVCGVVHVLGT